MYNIDFLNRYGKWFTMYQNRNYVQSHAIILDLHDCSLRRGFTEEQATLFFRMVKMHNNHVYDSIRNVKASNDDVYWQAIANKSKADQLNELRCLLFINGKTGFTPIHKDLVQRVRLRITLQQYVEAMGQKLSHMELQHIVQNDSLAEFEQSEMEGVVNEIAGSPEVLSFHQLENENGAGDCDEYNEFEYEPEDFEIIDKIMIGLRSKITDYINDPEVKQKNEAARILASHGITVATEGWSELP